MVCIKMVNFVESSTKGPVEVLVILVYLNQIKTESLVQIC